MGHEVLREEADKQTQTAAAHTHCATPPTFLNSDLRTTSGDKSPFLSVSPRLLCQGCQRKGRSEPAVELRTAGACSPETVLRSLL